MIRITVFLALLILIAGTSWGASNPIADMSWLSVSAPGNCNTTDNASSPRNRFLERCTDFRCLRTLIFPQFAAGIGWTTQITGFLPVQATTAGLVTGTVPG